MYLRDVSGTLTRNTEVGNLMNSETQKVISTIAWKYGATFGVDQKFDSCSLEGEQAQTALEGARIAFEILGQKLEA